MVEKGVVSYCTTFDSCIVKLRINNKAAKSHEKKKERAKKSGLAKFAVKHSGDFISPW